MFFLNDECSVLFLCKPEFSEKMKPHLLRFLQGWCVDWHSLDFWRAGVLAVSVGNFPWLPSSQQHMTHLWLTQHLSHHQMECANPFPTSPHSKAKAVIGEHWDLWQRPQHFAAAMTLIETLLCNFFVCYYYKHFTKWFPFWNTVFGWPESMFWGSQSLIFHFRTSILLFCLLWHHHLHPLEEGCN